MSAYLVAVTRRIASATSVIRTRAQDGERLTVHGGRNGELDARHMAAVRELEARVAKLEKAIS